MILKNIKLRNTDIDNSPFEGIILTACKDGEGLEVNLDDTIVFENIDGVIVDGKWQHRMLDFVEVLKKVAEHNITIFIDTELSMAEFKTRLGIASYNKVNNMKITRQDVSPNDIPMMEFTGAILMDYYLSHTKYYIASKENKEYVFNVIKLSNGDDEDGE